MTQTYVTAQGDMLDALAQRFYGVSFGATEAILQANRGLSDQPPMLPENLVIILPDAPAAAPKASINLWD